MSFILKDTITITATTGAASSFYSTAANGMVHSLVCRPPTTQALKAKAVMTICVESSLGPAILTVAPTTTRTVWYPRKLVVASTGVIPGSSWMSATVPVFNERVKVNIPAASSSLSLNGVLDIYYS